MGCMAVSRAGLTTLVLDGRGFDVEAEDVVGLAAAEGTVTLTAGLTVLDADGEALGAGAEVVVAVLEDGAAPADGFATVDADAFEGVGIDLEVKVGAGSSIKKDFFCVGL